MSNGMKPMAGKPPMTQSALLAGHKHTSRDLSEGVALSFPLISLRGGKWRYRWRGQENVIQDPNTGFAVPTLEVVLVDASKTLTKMFYRDAYAEGQSKRPDCWSSDGKVPDATVVDPVNEICLTCPKNAFGSAITPAGKPAKACQDRRRIVVTPANNLENEAQGGPILISIPPGSLKNSQSYGDFLDENNLAYYGCVTQLSFDQKVSHPKVEFTYLRPLDDDDVRTVLSLRGSEAVKRILNSQFNPDSPESIVDEPAAKPASAPSNQATASAPYHTTGKVVKSGINEAVKKPSAPPPSTRPVQTKPTPAQAAPGAHPVRAASLKVAPDEPEPEEDERAPSPMDDAFAKLMGLE
jgi:hypothetical protein